MRIALCRGAGDVCRPGAWVSGAGGVCVCLVDGGCVYGCWWGCVYGWMAVCQVLMVVWVGVGGCLYGCVWGVEVVESTCLPL